MLFANLAKVINRKSLILLKSISRWKNYLKIKDGSMVRWDSSEESKS